MAPAVTAAPITPILCKAARRLLGWNVLELARRAGSEPLALTRFEGHRGMLSLSRLTAIRRAFEEAGVEFPNGTPRMRVGP